MRLNDLFSTAVCIGVALGSSALTGCTQAEPAGQAPTFEPAPPAARDVLPQHGALLNGLPLAIDPDLLAGVWHSGTCRLEIGTGSASGAARVSGNCPPALMGVTGWQVEPEHRMRLDLVAAGDGASVWAGLMSDPDRLTGRAAQLGGWVWTRDAAAASTQGG